ncbi:MAG: ribosome biogenesis GTP-binding protein YihA/YsxC [Cytophagales bacterium]|nr:ribosome biogenesis GTP-binding protein YihA/YsxC [Cytophagales bacterium]MDW8385006.1 ribosome biogenesis GTP-binding protein YihA/YsxC [Flammeovirgaceae bacterium]
MKIHSAVYVGSANSYQNCPISRQPEYAFVGRSNVGKSSLINALVGTSVALVSSQPGKTKSINHFHINQSWYLVDLPGYGYAKTSKEQRIAFEKMVREYLLYRSNLACVFVLVDIRIPPQKSDVNFSQWLGEHQIPFAHVFTKVDAISQYEIQKAIRNFHQILKANWEELPPYFITSATQKIGVRALLDYIQNINRTFSKS